MKKRLISIALASVMALSLAGCGGSAGGTTTEADTSAPADTTAQASSEDTTAADDTSTEAAKTAADAGGTLIVGFDQDFPPMGFIGNDGEGSVPVIPVLGRVLAAVLFTDVPVWCRPLCCADLLHDSHLSLGGACTRWRLGARGYSGWSGTGGGQGPGEGYFCGT